MNSPYTDLVSIPEERLLDTIYADNLLRNPLGIPPSVRGPCDFRLRVSPSDLGLPDSLFGDVDALVVERGGADRASAVEYKRVKVTEISFQTGQLNKLKDLEKAAKQANALHDAGFAFVWLSVIVVADVRPITRDIGFAGTPLELINAVDDAVPLSKLHPSIGLQRSELTQVSSRPANERGGAGWQLLRQAVPQDQPQDLTEGIDRLLLRPVAS